MEIHSALREILDRGNWPQMDNQFSGGRFPECAKNMKKGGRQDCRGEPESRRNHVHELRQTIVFGPDDILRKRCMGVGFKKDAAKRESTRFDVTA